MMERELPRGSKGLDIDDEGLCMSQSKEDEKDNELLSSGTGRLGVGRRHFLLYNCQDCNCEVGGLDGSFQ